MTRDTTPFHRLLPDEAATARLAEAVACFALPGDRILLEGELGSGKTAFARAFLRALADDETLEVPSPSYTLVQTYAAGGLEVAHLDLYRIGDASELDELGVDELSTGVLLVEWPDRAGDRLAGAGLEVALAVDPEDPGARKVELRAFNESWERRLVRLRAVEATLGEAGIGGCRRRRLAGDASTRRYERLLADGRALILMDAPPAVDPGLPGAVPYGRQVHLAETVAPFVAIAENLVAHGLSAPRVLSADLDAGVLVLEDLGREGILDAEGRPVADRYLAAAELLAELAGQDWTGEIGERARHVLPRFDLDAMIAETMLTPQWFAPAALGRPLSEGAIAAYDAAWRQVLRDYAEGRRATGLVLRDFHSPNVLWLGDREGVARIGLLDFQDALVGPVAYDVASLATDARVDVPAELGDAVVTRYLEARRARGHAIDENALRTDVAVMAAQRASKVQGIFTRLAVRDGKTRYLAHLPRMHDYLDRALDEPLLQPVREWYDTHLPADVRRRATGGLDAAE